MKRGVNLMLKLGCDRAINCSNNGICENCTCKCYAPYTGTTSPSISIYLLLTLFIELNCSRFIGIYPAHAWEITIGLFVGLAIATIVTCVLISGQLVKMNPREFPGVIYLSKFTNIISIGVSLLACIPLCLPPLPPLTHIIFSLSFSHNLRVFVKYLFSICI